MATPPPESASAEAPRNLMLQEIKEQPAAVERCLRENAQVARDFAADIRERDIRFAIIAARGTSDNAAIYAKYLLETVCSLPVSLAAPSVWTLYKSELDLRNALVIGVSQSGQGTDVVEVVRHASEQGALTLGVTNFGDSLLAEAADNALLCHAGLEQSVAATKTYTTSLAALGLLTAILSNNDDLLAELHAVPEQMEAVLGTEGYIEHVAERYRYMNECMVIARGMNQCTAVEAGLKLAETCYLVTHAYSGADFQHGPIAVVEQGFPCILFNPEGPANAQIIELSHQLQQRGAERIMVAHDDASLAASDRSIFIPAAVPERVSPIVYIVAAQLFAYSLARHKGFDPDNPRGLKKVTLTR